MNRAGRHLSVVWTALALVAASLVVFGAEPARAEDPPPGTLKWIALGDSYSAGVGSNANPTANECRRQQDAYPVKTSNRLTGDGWRFWDDGDWLHACLGATTDHYWNPQEVDRLGPFNSVVQAQRNHVGDDVDVVTLTMGGNDLYFGDIIKGCVTGQCGFVLDGLDLDQLFDDLVAMYGDIRDTMRANGNLFVLSYPELFADPSIWTGADQCEQIGADDVRKINDASRRVGDTIFAAVQRANEDWGNVHFVDVRPAFHNKGLCAPNESLIRGISIDGLGTESFHPSSIGYEAMADVLEACMRSVIGAGVRCDEVENTAAAAEVGTVLIIDSSGSMNSNDRTDQRLAASRAYVAASLQSDEVGVVDFDARAIVRSELVQVGSHRTALASAIEGINSQGGTNLAAGLAEGCDVLSRSTATHRAALFFTDGNGAYSGQAQCFADNGWSIHTFGLGTAVSDELLASIASETGGTYTALSTATNLVCDFQQIRSLIAGNEPSACDADAAIAQDQTVELTETVTRPLRQITFTNVWPGSDIAMTVTSPSGSTYTRSSGGGGVTVEVGPTFETITIRRPELGTWSIKLLGTDIPGPTEPYSFSSVQLEEDPSITDLDGDGVANASDNCVSTSNPSQADLDGDGIGDACDSDLDGDTVGNDADSCPATANTGQTDADGDGVGDVCDPDNGGGPAVPVVDAGPDQTISVTQAAVLVGSATDDGAFATSWGVVSGDGDVAFTSPGSTTTVVSVSEPGTYVLALTASDTGGLIGSDTMTLTVDGPFDGYWLVEADGQLHGFGDATSHPPTGKIAVAVATDALGTGVWVLNSDGTVSVQGAATHHGDACIGCLSPGEIPSSISVRADGGGYWIFTSRGRAIAFGNAGHFGDLVSIGLADQLLGSVIASAATADGLGYLMIGADGGVFTFGSAVFAGSVPQTISLDQLDAPLVGIAPDGDGSGYWLVAADGGIFAFDARFIGSVPGILPPGTSLAQPVVGAIAYADGYLVVAADGGIFNFSSRIFLGSLGASPPNTPVRGVAAAFL